MNFNSEELFIINDKNVKIDIDNALKEQIVEEKTHPKLKRKKLNFDLDWYENKLISFTKKTIFKDLFNKDLDNCNYYILNKINKYRNYYLDYQHKIINFINIERNIDSKIIFISRMFKIIYLYKDLITNGYLLPITYYKAIIYKIIEYMKEGLIITFLLFCEFCPDFVVDDCYPKFYKSRFFYICEQIMSTDCFWTTLFLKHKDKWNKYILPQLN